MKKNKNDKESTDVAREMIKSKIHGRKRIYQTRREVKK